MKTHDQLRAECDSLLDIVASEITSGRPLEQVHSCLVETVAAVLHDDPENIRESVTEIVSGAI